MTSADTSYEAIPYESFPLHWTHPDNLAALATLFGLTPAPVENCRVLELGCATGGNIISMADGLPGSRFVGLDLSPGQIATARAQADALGLKNLDLRAMSILDIGPDFGTFDYIISHGVYSWVPPAVQDHILRVCSENLAPNGVAYVSYNVYPGWHISGMIRDMVNFHGRQFPDPRERIGQVRSFLDFLTGLVGRDPEHKLYHQLLAQQVEALREDGDSYLFHEYLEEFNQPVYFHQFAERAAAKKLQFLCEARLSSMTGTLPAEVKDQLWKWSADVVQFEQYVDFARNRRFRMSLLCPQSAAVNRTPRPEAMNRFRFTSFARAQAAPDGAGPDVLHFQTPSGVTASTNNPWIKTVLSALIAAAPRGLTFAALLDRTGPDAVEPLSQALFQCALSSLVDLHVHSPAFAARPSERPVGSPLARSQALTGERVTSRIHRTVELRPLDRLLLPLLDGSRDRPALVAALAERVRDGLPLRDETDQEVHDPAKVREMLDRGVEAGLQRLARSALLVG